MSDLPLALRPPGDLVTDRDETERYDIAPQHDAVFFRQRDPSRDLRTGLYTPRGAEGQQHYQVVAVGPGRMLEDGRRYPMCVAPGDRFLLWPRTTLGPPLEVTGEKLYACRDSDIATVLLPVTDGAS